MTRISPRRPPPSGDPLVGVTRLLVDGTNLLHALSPGPDRQPPAALIGRLRAAIPPETSIELVFDGPTERGLKNERIAHGVSVRYGGRFSADTILVTLVEEAAGGASDAAPGSLDVLVVTDDRGLRYAVTRRGARAAGSSWLLRRLDRRRLAAPFVGNQRPPAIAQPPAGSSATAEDPDGPPGWSPGRGATRKRGNAKREPKRR